MCLQTWVCIAYRNVLKHTRSPRTPGHIRTKESLSQLQLRLDSGKNGGTSIIKRLVLASLSFIACRCVLRHARSPPAPATSAHRRAYHKSNWFRKQGAKRSTSMIKRLVLANLRWLAYRCVLKHVQSPSPGHIRTDESSS